MIITENNIKTFSPADRHAWRAWLQEHHEKEKSVWLIFLKNNTDLPKLTWSEAVDEALCFGWIDSIAKPVDELSFMRFFSRRKPNSVWSAINKEKVEKLIASGQMIQAGLDCVETARKNGSWTILDTAESLIIPPDLAKAFQESPEAENYFLSLSRTDRKNILQWLVLAKREYTRQKRITEIVELAAQHIKPKAIRWTKKTAHE